MLIHSVSMQQIIEAGGSVTVEVLKPEPYPFNQLKGIAHIVHNDIKFTRSVRMNEDMSIIVFALNPEKPG